MAALTLQLNGKRTIGKRTTMSNKVKAAIIGPGNIGTDLLMKAMRSDLIEPAWMVGVVAESPGLARAQEMGLKTTAEGCRRHGADHAR